MQKFIDSTIKPFFIIGGIGTAAASMNAFFPRFAVENLQKLEFVGSCIASTVLTEARGRT